MHMRYAKLEKELRKELDDDRYVHTLGVAYTAACMAMRFGESMERAYLAGLLHDCAKCVDHKKRISLCESNGIALTDFETENPFLIHAKLGSFLAKTKYGVEDEEILSAIRWHTTGRAGMTLLEKIIFTADYIEPNRKKQPDLEKVRHLCFQDLDAGVTRILQDTLEYLEGLKPIDPTTKEAYEYYASRGHRGDI